MSDGVANLFEILKASKGETGPYSSLMEDYNAGRLRYAELKEAVSNAVIDMLQPFNTKRAELAANKKDLKNQIKESSLAIRKRAQETVREVKDLVGLMNAR